MLSSNKSDFVVKLSIKDNTDGSNTYPINGCIITDDNLDKFDIDEKIIKEMSKIIYLEMIKIKNSNNFNKNS